MWGWGTELRNSKGQNPKVCSFCSFTGGIKLLTAVLSRSPQSIAGISEKKSLLEQRTKFQSEVSLTRSWFTANSPPQSTVSWLQWTPVSLTLDLTVTNKQDCRGRDMAFEVNNWFSLQQVENKKLIEIILMLVCNFLISFYNTFLPKVLPSSSKFQPKHHNHQNNTEGFCHFSFLPRFL